MRLHAPNQTLWIVAIILGTVGTLSTLGAIHVPYALYMLIIGFVLLAVGTKVRGL